MSDYRAALNCSFRQQEGDGLCPRCGDPLRVHAPQGMALSDLGYIHGNHPAWVASTSDSRLGAAVREAVGCMNAHMIEGHTTSPGFTHRQERIISVHQLNVLRAIADALRAKEGGSDAA